MASSPASSSPSPSTSRRVPPPFFAKAAETEPSPSAVTRVPVPPVEEVKAAPTTDITKAQEALPELSKPASESEEKQEAAERLSELLLNSDQAKPDDLHQVITRNDTKAGRDTATDDTAWGIDI
jgi:hypothetical protein